MNRDRNIDLIRATAVFFVVSVHFLSYIGFNEQEITGWPFFAASMLRVIFITCVPLFLLITGYLQLEKGISKRYYIGLFRAVFSYLICGILCQCYVMVVDRDEWSLRDAVLALLDFKGAPYGWYIEMYIGLYFLIPFLNILWRALSHEQKKVLLISLVLLTSIPSIFNNFNFKGTAVLYATKESYSAIFPDWWQNIYPITYYYLGAYIKENKDRVCAIKHLPLMLISQIIMWGGKLPKKLRADIPLGYGYELSGISMYAPFTSDIYNAAKNKKDQMLEGDQNSCGRVAGNISGVVCF